MLSHAQTGRSRVISYHLRDIGRYRSTVGYIFAILKKEPQGNLIGGQVESMCRLTHVIPSVLIKDRTIIGTSDKTERMPLTQLAG